MGLVDVDAATRETWRKTQVSSVCEGPGKAEKLCLSEGLASYLAKVIPDVGGLGDRNVRSNKNPKLHTPCDRLATSFAEPPCRSLRSHRSRSYKAQAESR